MRTAYSLGSLLTVNEVLECARILSDTDVDTIWIPETWGMENFAMLGAISQLTNTPNIGSSIVNIYSRSPAAIAMGAATVDTLTDGKLILGLGTSSIPIVKNFHGYEFEQPIKRMKEYVGIIRKITTTQNANYEGDIFNIKNFSLLIKPPRKYIPIYLAAVNKKMVNLTWDIADGVIFYLRPITEIKQTVLRMQSRRRIDVTCQIITCVSEDVEAAITRAKKTLGFYISVGKVYREFLAENGFRTETKNIANEYEESGLNSASKLVTDKMLDSLTITGTPDDCQRKILPFYKAGIDIPILQFNPVGDTIKSFKLLAKTFSSDL